MQRITRWFAAMALFGALGFGGAPVRAQTESVLYTFSSGADGSEPIGGVIRDKKGNLYAAASAGGNLNWISGVGRLGAGVVFELSPPKKGHTAWTETALYTFSGGSDGAAPSENSLIMDKQGNLYGTTYNGGDLSANGGLGAGVVFELSPPYGQSNETVLYTFSGGADGGYPEAGVIMDKKGNLYGTTQFGGISNAGVVFKLSPPYGQSNETVLYTFSGGADGGYPNLVSLIRDKKGNLYGTTEGGGDLSANGGLGAGVVFELSPPKKGHTAWTEAVLYTFSGGSDGGSPYAGVIMDKQHNLYGTTWEGGAGFGVVFKLSSPYGQSHESVLYTFSGGMDGANPPVSLIMDKTGNLYGTTYFGGDASQVPYGAGVVFKLTPPYGQSSEKVLFRFTGGSDGAKPQGRLFMDKQGNLYGTAYAGGDLNFVSIEGYRGAGVVFEITP